MKKMSLGIKSSSGTSYFFSFWALKLIKRAISNQVVGRYMFHQNKPFYRFFLGAEKWLHEFSLAYFFRFRCSTVRPSPITITQTTLSSFLFSKSIQMDLCRRTRSLLARCLMAAVYCTNGNKDPIFRGQKCKDSNFCYKIRRWW